MLEVNRWMNDHPVFVNGKHTIQDAGNLMMSNKLESLPIVNEANKPIGIVSIYDMMRFFVCEDEKDLAIENRMSRHFSTIHFKENILEEFTSPFVDKLVVDDDNKLVGLLQRQDLLRAYAYHIQSLDQTDNTAAILSIILESAYEGIAVVDKEGLLIEFNEAYSRFTGIDRADAIGKHVTEVIENTKLHRTVKTKIPDRGVLQNIQGQDMIVHRIPIWKNGNVIGAIGMLIFEGVTEVYRIYERLNFEKLITGTSPRSKSSSTEKNNSLTMNQIIGDSDATAHLKRMARKSAQSKATVLLTGEKGTGKRTYARSIHDHSLLTSGDFIEMNCSITSADALEKKLFGTEKELGALASIGNGTLFLEDIEYLSVELQIKLLEVLQNKKITQLKDKKIYPLSLRLITSTKANLKKQVEAKQFNSSLYNKISIIHLAIPPLRDRKEDIPILLSYYTKEICYYHQVPGKTFTPDAVSVLIQYRWDENVEEMMNVLEKIISMTDEREIGIDHLPEKIKKAVFEKNHAPEWDTEGSSLIEQIKDKRDEREKELIISILKKAEGNKSKAAEMLGVHRTTLYKKLKKHKL